MQCDFLVKERSAIYQLRKKLCMVIIPSNKCILLTLEASLNCRSRRIFLYNLIPLNSVCNNIFCKPLYILICCPMAALRIVEPFSKNNVWHSFIFTCNLTIYNYFLRNTIIWRQFACLRVWRSLPNFYSSLIWHIYCALDF